MAADQETIYIIVLGNEKGWHRQVTVAMHIIRTFFREAIWSGSIDVDARVRELYHVMLRIAAHRRNGDLPLPDHAPIFRSKLESIPAAGNRRIGKTVRVLIVSKTQWFYCHLTHQNDTHLSRLAHSYADTLKLHLWMTACVLDMLVRVNWTHTTFAPALICRDGLGSKKQRAICAIMVYWLGYYFEIA